jgi:ornithine cyclodeaminase
MLTEVTMPLLILSKNDIKQLLDMNELIAALREAYISYSSNKIVQMKRAVASVDQSSIVVNFPGYLEDSEYYTVKVNVKNPNNRLASLPFLQGTIQLIQRATGKAVALFESSLITAMRTGAAGAIGVEALAPRGLKKVALIGAGTQGEWQIRALSAVERLGSVIVYDIHNQNAIDFCGRLSQDISALFRTSDSITAAVSDADVIITATPSLEPILDLSMINPGTHVSAFGADQPNKIELGTELVLNSHVVVDDADLAITDGALNVHFCKGLLTESLYPEIGEVLSGKVSGRTTPEQITIFANVGLAFQDLVACELIYNKALQTNSGVFVDFC